MFPHNKDSQSIKMLDTENDPLGNYSKNITSPFVFFITEWKYLEALNIENKLE